MAIDTIKLYRKGGKLQPNDKNYVFHFVLVKNGRTDIRTVCRHKYNEWVYLQDWDGSGLVTRIVKNTLVMIPLCRHCKKKFETIIAQAKKEGLI